MFRKVNTSQRGKSPKIAPKCKPAYLFTLALLFMHVLLASMSVSVHVCVRACARARVVVMVVICAAISFGQSQYQMHLLW